MLIPSNRNKIANNWNIMVNNGSKMVNNWNIMVNNGIKMVNHWNIMVNNWNIVVHNGNIMLNNWNIVVHNGSVSNFPQWGIPKLKWLVYNRKSLKNGWFGGIPVSGNHHMYIYAYMCVEMQANMYTEIYSCVKVVNKGEVYQSFAQFHEPVGKSLRMIIPQNPQNNSE